MISRHQLIFGLLIFSLAACSAPTKKGDTPSANNESHTEPPDATAGSDAGAGATDVANDSSTNALPSEVTSTSSAVSSPTTGAERYQALAKAVRSGNGEGVRTETTKILGRDASDPVALNATALYYYRKGQIGAAKIVLEKAFEKNPNNASLYNNIGVMSLAQDDMATAIVNFKKALSIDPKHVEASENLGAIYVAGGDYIRAQSLLELAYHAKRSASSGVNYAITLRNAKKYSDAEQVYQEVIKNYPRDASAQLDYALLLIDYMNRPKDGLALVYKVKFLETEKRDVVNLTNVLEQKAKSEIKE